MGVFNKGIFALVKANIRYRKSSIISVFILMTVVAMIFASAVSVQDNVTRRASQANDSVGTGDLVMFISDEIFSDETESELENSSCTERIRVTDSLLSSDTAINGTKAAANVYFTAYDPQSSPYGIFNDEADDFISDAAPLSDGEIYLPIALKKMYSCEKGDTVLLKLYDETVDFTVAGFVEEPFMGCDVIPIKNLFITQNDFDMLHSKITAANKQNAVNGTPSVSAFKLVHIYATDEYVNNSTELSKKLNDETGIPDLSFHLITCEQAQTYTLILPKILCGVLYLFLVLLMVVVAMVISNNIGTSIEMEYVNIGILKAQGISKGKIRFVFIVQYILPALTGSTVGLLLSFAVVDYIRVIFIKASCLMISNEILFGRSIIVMLIMTALLCLFLYAKTSGVSKVSPVRAISGGLESISVSRILRTNVLGSSKAFTGVRLALRQLTSNVRQYIGTGLILAFLVCYLSTCCAFKENFTEKFYDEMYGTVSADICVDYNDHLDLRSEAEAEISAISPVTDSFAYSESDLYLDGVRYKAQILDDLSYLKSITDGTKPENDSEILITNYLSKKINRKIGDSLTVKKGESSKKFKICGLYDGISAGGSTFAITFDAAETVDPELKPDQIYYIIGDSTQNDKINTALEEKLGDSGVEIKSAKKQSESTINTVMDAMNAMIFLIFTVAVIFTVIVVWMVCIKSFLKERLNIGIYKAYGFSVFSLKIQFCFRYLIVAFFACVFGAIMYTFLGDSINLTTLMALGITKFDAPLTLTSYLIPPVLMLVSVLFASYITLGRIKKVAVRELVVE